MKKSRSRGVYPVSSLVRRRTRRRAAGSRACPGSPNIDARCPGTPGARTRATPRSSSRGPRPAISQSRTATGSKSRYMTLPIRGVAPADDRSSPSSSGQCVVEPGEAALDERRAARTPRRPTRTRPACAATWRRRAESPGCVEGEERRTGPRSRLDAVQLGEHRDRRVLQLPLVGRRARRSSQLSPNVYGITSGGTTPSTCPITKNGAPSMPGVGLAPVQRRDRHRRRAADVADDLELALEVVRREHGDVDGIGRDAGHEITCRPAGALVPLGREQDRVAGEARGGRRRYRCDRGGRNWVQARAQPLLELVLQDGRLATGPLQLGRNRSVPFAHGPPWSGIDRPQSVAQSRYPPLR